MYRKQYVVLNGERSTTCSATSEVPQGSVLAISPLMIWSTLDENTVTLYADDLILYTIINYSHDFRYVQEGIDNVQRWVAENNLHYVKL